MKKIKKWFPTTFIFCILAIILPILISSSKTSPAEVVVDPLKVEIKKRIEWLDANNGNAEITLAYQSEIGIAKDYSELNVIIIQDKSGSMRSNYGYELQFTENNWTEKQVIPFPIQNSQAYSEVID